MGDYWKEERTPPFRSNIDGLLTSTPYGAPLIKTDHPLKRPSFLLLHTDASVHPLFLRSKLNITCWQGWKRRFVYFTPKTDGNFLLTRTI